MAVVSISLPCRIWRAKAKSANVDLLGGRRNFQKKVMGVAALPSRLKLTPTDDAPSFCGDKTRLFGRLKYIVHSSTSKMVPRIAAPSRLAKRICLIYFFLLKCVQEL